MNPVKGAFKYLLSVFIIYVLVYNVLIFSKFETVIECAEFIFSSLLLALTLFILCQLVRNKVLQPLE